VTTKSAVPTHLKPATKAWFIEVSSRYELEQHHRMLLTLAGEAWDRVVEAREVIDREGLTFTNRFLEPKARPEIAIERDNRIAFARLMRELALDVEPPAESPRPPRRGGQ